MDEFYRAHIKGPLINRTENFATQDLAEQWLRRWRTILGTDHYDKECTTTIVQEPVEPVKVVDETTYQEITKVWYEILGTVNLSGKAGKWGVQCGKPKYTSNPLIYFDTTITLPEPNNLATERGDFRCWVEALDPREAYEKATERIKNLFDDGRAIHEALMYISVTESRLNIEGNYGDLMNNEKYRIRGELLIKK